MTIRMPFAAHLHRLADEVAVRGDDVERVERAGPAHLEVARLDELPERLDLVAVEAWSSHAPTLNPLYSGGLWLPVIIASPSTGSVLAAK